MHNHSTTTADVELTDEEMLSYTVSDEALEAAGGRQLGDTRKSFVTASGCCHVTGPKPKPKPAPKPPR